MFFEQIGGGAHHAGIQERLPLGIVKRGDWHAPGTLARDTPIRARFHGAFDAVAAPFGHPAHLRDGRQRLVPKVLVIHLDEPLVHGAENHGCLAAPTMRVTVGIILFTQERLAPREHFQHRFVGFAFTLTFQDGFTDQLGGHLLIGGQIAGVAKAAIIVHR